MHAMKRLYSAGTALEAHDLRFYLAAHGIEAKVFGDNNAWEGAFAFTPQSAPGVFVSKADLDAASKVLEEFLNRAPIAKVEGQWTCPSCNEHVEAQFDQCWNCESPRGGTPLDANPPAVMIDDDRDEDVSDANQISAQEDASSVPQAPAAESAPPRANPLLWLELLVVLSLTTPL